MPEGLTVTAPSEKHFSCLLFSRRLCVSAVKSAVRSPPLLRALPLPKSPLQNPCPALLHGMAGAPVLQILQKLLHRAHLIDLCLQFNQLPIRHRLPPRGNRHGSREPAEQFPDLRQREADLLRPPHHRKPMDYRRIVPALPASARCRREYAHLLVIPNGRCPQAHLPGRLGNRKVRHDSDCSSRKKVLAFKST